MIIYNNLILALARTVIRKCGTAGITADGWRFNKKKLFQFDERKILTGNKRISFTKKK